MNATQSPEATKIIVSEALNKTISDAKENGIVLTVDMIINETVENPEGSIAKRFIQYINLGKKAFEMVAA